MEETFNVEITQSAETDLENIWEYISQTDPEAALIFIQTLEEHISSLEQFPFRCPHIPENEIFGTNYRHLLHGAYRIIFKISDSHVIIMRVIHGGRLFE